MGQRMVKLEFRPRISCFTDSAKELNAYEPDLDYR